MSDAGRPRDPDVDDRILAAARQILDAEGAGAVSVARVAREAGVGRPTVYRRFQDAGDLLRGVLFAELDAILQANREIIAALEPEGPVIDDLLFMARPSFLFYASNPERSKALLTSAILAEPRWQARWDALNAEIAMIAMRVLQAGVSRGELPADTDLMLTVQAYMLLLLGTLLSGLVGAFGPDVDDWVEALRRLLQQHLEGLHLRAQG